MKVNYLAKFRKAVRGRVAVFIDVANLEQSVKTLWVNAQEIPEEFQYYRVNQLRWCIDYQSLKKFFGCNCCLQEIYFYSPRFGASNHEKFLTFVKNAGFRLITKPLKKYLDHSKENPHRKANFDVEIAVDAMRFEDNYDTFILFSGDCDFEYLIKILQAMGKTCLIFSTRGCVAKELLRVSDYYFDIFRFRKRILRIRNK